MTEPLSGGARSAGTMPGAAPREHPEGDAVAIALDPLDWSEAPCAALGRVMARRDVDLATAVCVFFRGAPERFNYLPKWHVPDGYRPVARQLDNICLRINSGFYLPAPGGRLGCRDTLDRWLDYQRADRQEGRCGRWVLNEDVLAPLFDTAGFRASPTRGPETGLHGLWRAVLVPLRGLWGARGVGRLHR